MTSQLTFAQEWTTLFDGSDLGSFNTLGEAQWIIIDDYVEADGYTGSYLVTKDDYGDFENLPRHPTAARAVCLAHFRWRPGGLAR